MYKVYLWAIVLSFITVIASAQSNTAVAKKRLSPAVYNSWKTIGNQEISNDGNWVSYVINPAKGDGFLYLYNVSTHHLDSIARGKNAHFAPNSTFLVFKIIPQYDTLRKLKLKKTAKTKLPKDSLGIWILANDSIIKIAKAGNYKITQRGESWIAYVDKTKKIAENKEKEKRHWLFFKKKTPQKKNTIKQRGSNIVLYNPIKNKIKRLPYVDEFLFNYNGNSFFTLTVNKKDSSKVSEITKINLQGLQNTLIFKGEGTAGKLGVSRDGEKVGFLFAQDTAKTNKIYSLYFWASNDSTAKLLADTSSKFIFSNWSPSINARPHFSIDGSKMYFGTAPRPKQEPKDTLLPEEKYHLDIWNYKDKLLQPQQKLQANQERKRTYLAQYNIDIKQLIQLADTIVRNVYPAHEGTAKYALGIDNMKYAREQSWDGWYDNYYAINIFDGSKELVLEHQQGYAALSPGGFYIVYFKNKNWYVYDINARKHINLTKDLNVNFYDELHDTPNEAPAYGLVGWYSNDKYLVVKDRYDLWRLDPTAKSEAVNLTHSYGRENNIRFTPIIFNRAKHYYFNQENPHYLRAFYETNKNSGYYRIDLSAKKNPQKLIVSANYYYYPIKSLNSDKVIFRRSSFKQYPDLLLSTINFKNPIQISHTNPQQSEYLWGSVKLVHWKAFDGENLEGLLYKPEGFDSTKRYPVIVYFYERYSNDIHRHYIPKPSHSIINFSEYTSNGYVIFIPDITYKTGHPAKSAYNAIVSGTEFLENKFPWVDKKHIGIQGQSWGGYQVAMLVTMTNIYACAEAGAPVSNMTSAYGGIRWGSGMSRAFQYEKTQSRIGATLWDSLDLYIENSPVFFANKVTTPLLIMHNDKDGAVPWYQGIEYFNALRRLGKKVWMLSYNNDDHNLMKWPNRVDLSIRMMQFFNHYLKGAPMPAWMSKGLPATRKGKYNAYELDKK